MNAPTVGEQLDVALDPIAKYGSSGPTLLELDAPADSGINDADESGALGLDVPIHADTLCAEGRPAIAITSPSTRVRFSLHVAPAGTFRLSTGPLRS